MKKIVLAFIVAAGLFGVAQSSVMAESISQDQCVPNNPCLYSGECYYYNTAGELRKANMWITVKKNNYGDVVAIVSQSSYANIPNGSTYAVQSCRKGRFNKCFHAAETMYFQARF